MLSTVGYSDEVLTPVVLTHATFQALLSDKSADGQYGYILVRDKFTP